MVVIGFVGQAFAIFKTREVAEMIVKKLNEGCLLVSNGRYVWNFERIIMHDMN